MITKLKASSIALLKKYINKKTKSKPQEPELVFEYIQGLVVSNMYLRMYETVYVRCDQQGIPSGM